jgi:hypothetical protein
LVKANGVQFGTVTGSVTTGTSYIFAGTSPTNIPAGGSITVDVYADILSTATNLGSSYYVKLKDASAVGAITATTETLKDISGNAISANNINGQAFTPSAYQAVMGKTNQTFGIWRINGGTTENANITEITIKDKVGTAGNRSSLSNLQWYKGGVAVGPIVTSSTASGTAGAETGYKYNWTFTSPIVVPQNSGIALELRGDVSSYASGGATSNSIHIFTFNADGTYILARGAGSSLTTIVNDSAGTALGTASTFAGISGTTTDVSAITVTRSKLTVTSDATGITTSGHSASSADVMAVFVFSAEGYDVTINTVTLKLAGSSLATINVRLIDADTGSTWGSTANRATYGQGNASSSIAFYPTYTLSAGATKRVKVVADTTGSETASDTAFTATTGSTNGTLAQWYIDNDTTGLNGSITGNALCWSDSTAGLCSTKAGFNLETKILPIYGPAIRY